MCRARILLSFCLISLFACPPATAVQTQRDRLSKMTDRAKSTSVKVVGSPSSSGSISLLSEPLNRYSDQPRGILDGTLWCWVRDGRPVAFQKIEVYDESEPSLRWFYCLASASPDRIRVTWKAGERWTATEPGVDMKPIVDEPAPGKNELRVALQLKRISRRFSVRLEDPIADTSEQLRLIPRPIYEYGKSIDAESRGAVFRFASNGTNPDALLIVELAKSDSGNRWQFGWIQMTTGKLVARMDGQTVWTAPYRTPNASKPSKFESWLFFHESAAGR